MYTNTAVVTTNNYKTLPVKFTNIIERKNEQQQKKITNLIMNMHTVYHICINVIRTQHAQIEIHKTDNAKTKVPDPPIVMADKNDKHPKKSCRL